MTTRFDDRFHVIAGMIAMSIGSLATKAAFGQSETRGAQLREAFGVLDRRDLATEPRGDLLLPKRFGLHVFAAAAAGLEASGPGEGVGLASLSAGAQASLENELCSALALGGAANLSAELGSHRKSVEQWGSICILRGASNWTLGYHLDFDVRQALRAPLKLPPGPNRSFTIDADVEALSIPIKPEVFRLQPGPPVYFGVFVIDVEMSILLPGDAFDVLSDADFAAVRFRRDRPAAVGERTFNLEALAVEHQGSNDAFVINMYAARLSNLKLGPVYVDADIGGGFASAGEFVNEFDREVESGGQVLARLGVGGDLGRLRGEFVASRDLRAAYGGRLLIDHRVEGAAELRGDKVTARLRPFLGATRLLSAETPSAYHRTGGVSVDLKWRVQSWLSLTATGDAAKSFYAVDAPETDAPRLGIQALVGIVADWNR